ncbi:MAG: hypothetical protein PF569_07920 [Candidatus Woesearchaeota archaeon]|nr:hypothetical protein [Candidatus Woesearchaeota archaeon]
MKNKEITYYQPKTERLEESIRKFNPEPIFFDYSHIGPEDQGYGFVNNSISKTYFILKEK